MNADVEKAVGVITDHIADLTRCIGVLAAYPEMKPVASEFEKATKELAPVAPALRDQEAEIARLRGKVARYATREPINSVRVSELACRAMSAEDRCKKADALLSETWGFMRDAGIDWDDSKTGSLRDRITAHLGGDHG